MEQMRKRRKVGEAKLRGVLEPKGEVAMTARSTRSLTGQLTHPPPPPPRADLAGATERRKYDAAREALCTVVSQRSDAHSLAANVRQA